ncbi:hypothetical protein CLAFUW4_04351 [Fulvia fulva]|uniref:Ankyrin repeat domain-containing protein n=1 Tax=Passalora fulva TaxID=5499 RepID=A0A9Q8LGM8_PASFU|nr:uncharacterized protein CLAFUR5_04314 [Fulvia fulva]KAK4627333.1 hypothetical protein CLAFUR4_04337 [Fulvia fulva]UJO17058.1 hypothetical protein CLAFUR5_04314 [Fulvia fulva]WPV13740.1 hypothetical protein CLAFUW4_04351 [Fulvia fulva]WPV29163.1 hypothetical protein CLAFUW7_04340 [Fulvia fulva]
MAAANEGEMDCVRLLLEHGADVNLCRRLDEDGSLLTALSSACERPLWNGYYSFLNPEDVASCLVSAGANVNLGDPTPLDWALEYHTAFGLVKFLLRAGAHISRVNDETISGLAGKALGVGSFHSWEYRQPTDKLQLLQKKAAREAKRIYHDRGLSAEEVAARIEAESLLVSYDSDDVADWLGKRRVTHVIDDE